MFSRLGGGPGVGFVRENISPGQRLLNSSKIYLPLLASDLYSAAGTWCARNHGTLKTGGFDGAGGYKVGDGTVMPPPDPTTSGKKVYQISKNNTHSPQNKGLRSNDNAAISSSGAPIISIPAHEFDLDTQDVTLAIRYFDRGSPYANYTALAAIGGTQYYPRAEIVGPLASTSPYPTKQCYFGHRGITPLLPFSKSHNTMTSLVFVMSAGAGGTTKIYQDGYLVATTTKWNGGGSTADVTAPDHIFGGTIWGPGGGLGFTGPAGCIGFYDIVMGDGLWSANDVTTVQRFWRCGPERKHVVFLFGQSNGNQKETPGATNPAFDPLPDARYQCLKYNGEGNPSAEFLVVPSAPSPLDASQGVEISFAKTKGPTNQIYVGACVSGTGMASWDPGSSAEGFTRFYDNVAASLYAIGCPVIADTILVVGAETDASSSGSAAAFAAVLARVVQVWRQGFQSLDAWISFAQLAPETATAASSPNTYYATINSALTAYPGTSGDTKFASWANTCTAANGGLQTPMNVHYANPVGLDIVGAGLAGVTP